ncbi:Major facilitator superfamily protein [gamma proteobacterium HdN1]|nr:Major facilitator superfamily protein [gamma proteobacterium HdN1]
MNKISASTGLWVATVVLVTLNLRPFLTAVGPITPVLQEQTGMSLTTISWLTLLPMALMGISTWLAPSAQRYLGARLTLLIALAGIAFGNALRLVSIDATLLIATAAVCGVSVALVQGVLPGLIKQRNPKHVASIMGVFSAALMLGGALGAQFTPLAMQWGTDWREALALWALPVFPVMVLVAVVVRGEGFVTRERGAGNSVGASGLAMSGGSVWLLRRKRTWLLMVMLGLVNGGYASMVAWVPPHYQTLGWSATRTGTLIAVISIAQALAALILPFFARRNLDRRPWLWFTAVCQVLGFFMLANWPLVWPLMIGIVLGIGLGGFFALIMVVGLDHLHDPVQAGILSAVMQGGGYLLTAISPWLVAALQEASGGFSAGWWWQMAASCLVVIFVFWLDPNRYARVMGVVNH